MAATGNRSNVTRLGELDALRGIAALAVVLYHYTYFISEFVPGSLPSVQLEWGCHGVSLFFGISGFVISTTLSRTDSVTGFAWRRAVRLLPSYWLAMLVTGAAVAAAGAERFAVPLADWPANLLMVQFWTGARMIDGVYWTLNVELAFYICLAVIWRAGWLGRIEQVVGAWLGLALLLSFQPGLPAGLRVLLVSDDLPFFAVGILAARIHSGERRPREQLPLVVAAVGVAWLARGGEATLVCAVVALTLVAVATGMARAIVSPPLLWLGRISYPLYLTHAVIGYIVIAALRSAGWPVDAATAATLGLSLLLADGVTRWYDEPVRAWLSRQQRRRVVPLPA